MWTEAVGMTSSVAALPEDIFGTVRDICRQSCSPAMESAARQRSQLIRRLPDRNTAVHPHVTVGRLRSVPVMFFAPVQEWLKVAIRRLNAPLARQHAGALALRPVREWGSDVGSDSG